MSTNELQLVKGELRLVHWCTGGKVDCGTLNCSCFGGKVDCTSWALHWCSGALQCRHWCKSGFCTGDPPCTASSAARAPNETLSGNHHILSQTLLLSCKTAAGSIAREIRRSSCSREHGKLGSGELQVNSIVPPLTFGLFASLLPPCLPPFLCLSLTYSTLLLFSFVQYSFAFTPHFSEARPACLHGRPPGTCSPGSGWKKRLNAS